MPAKLYNVLFWAIEKEKFDHVRERHAQDARAFARLRESFEVTFIKHHEPGYSPSNEPDIIYLEGTNRFFFLPSRLSVLAARVKPEVVFVHGFSFPWQLLVLRLCLPGRTRFIVQHHAEMPLGGFVKAQLQKMTYRSVDAFLFTAREIALPFISRNIITDPARVHEVMESSCSFSPGSMAAARQATGVKAEKIFLWVGRLTPGKDPMTVLKGFAKYCRVKQDACLYMAYGAEDLLEEVREFVAESGLDKFVRLLGRVPYADLENWYRSADVFLSGSHHESGGYALCEAMSCGCIPVVTRIPAYVKLTADGKAGFLFNKGDSDDVARLLLAVSGMDTAPLREKILDQFRSELSFDAIAGKLDKIVKQLLAE
jgi:glycosyltransferase involved in cell wall biosynthesis